MSSGRSPEGLANFRDVAAEPGVRGILRPGVLFRSESPQFLTEAGAVDIVHTLGIRLVLDLRFRAEAQTEGRGPLGDHELRYLSLPVLGTGGENIDVAVPIGDEGGMLTAHYISFLRDSSANLVAAVRALADNDGYPALVHCAAGKDRTGVLIALVLDLLGVEEDAIVADYARTGDNMAGVLASLATTVSYGASVASHVDDDERAKARPESLRRFLDWLRANHGTAEKFLLDSGLEPEAITRLRRTLREPQASEPEPQASTGGRP